MLFVTMSLIHLFTVYALLFIHIYSYCSKYARWNGSCLRHSKQFWL